MTEGNEYLDERERVVSPCTTPRPFSAPTERERARWRSSEFGQLISFSFSDTTLIIRVVITTHDGGGGGGGGENSDVCLVRLSLNLL